MCEVNHCYRLDKIINDRVFFKKTYYRLIDRYNQLKSACLNADLHIDNNINKMSILKDLGAKDKYKFDLLKRLEQVALRLIKVENRIFQTYVEEAEANGTKPPIKTSKYIDMDEVEDIVDTVVPVISLDLQEFLSASSISPSKSFLTFNF